MPWFNWGPAYLEIAQSVIDGTFTADFQWNGPDWADMNNPDTTAICYVKGPGLSSDDEAILDEFMAGLADGSINLWQGPLTFQDGTEWISAGETATPVEIWYTKQLLLGIDGASEA